MTDADRDFLMWKNGRGRYAAGKQHHGAKTPQEGGIFSSLYSGAQTSASCPQGREPITEPEVMPYAPPRMERIAGESKDAPDPSTVMDFEPIAEVPEDVYTPPFMFAPAAR